MLASASCVPSSRMPGRGIWLWQCSATVHWLLRLLAAPDLGWAGPQGWQLQVPATPSGPPDTPMTPWQAVKNRVNLVKAFGGFTHEPEAEAKVRRQMSWLCWPFAWRWMRNAHLHVLCHPAALPVDTTDSANILMAYSPPRSGLVWDLTRVVSKNVPTCRRRLLPWSQRSLSGSPAQGT